MTKSSQQNQKPDSTVSNPLATKKRTRRSVPRDSPPQRSSIYRGVTRHRWTGRYEAHLWDKNCWNETQNKKGRQVYLDYRQPSSFMKLKGAYNDEEAAAHAYDLAALKYWGPDTILNFPLPTYQKELRDMEGQSREEYIGSLRRKSSGFSRGVSKYRGVARHHHNGRWEARIGRVFGNKYLYLGTYATQEEAATAYDLAAIEYRGLNAVTNFELSRYIKWLKPTNQDHSISPDFNHQNPNSTFLLPINPNQEHELGFFPTNPELSPVDQSTIPHTRSPSATSALGLLLQSTKFKEMMEMSSIDDGSLPVSGAVVEASLPLFPRDLQMFLGSENSQSFGEEDDVVFGDLNSFISPNFSYDFDDQELGESAMEELGRSEVRVLNFY